MLGQSTVLIEKVHPLDAIVREVCTAFAQEKGADTSFSDLRPMWFVMQAVEEGMFSVHRTILISARQLGPRWEEDLCFAVTFKKVRIQGQGRMGIRKKMSLFELKVACEDLHNLNEKARRCAIRGLLEAAWDTTLLLTDDDCESVDV